MGGAMLDVSLGGGDLCMVGWRSRGEPASVPYLGQWIQNGPYILPEMSPWSIKKPPRTPGTRLPWIKSLCPVGACKILLFDQERTGNLEDPLKKEMATYSSILAWEMPWTEELVDYSPSSQKELDTIERAHTHTLL